MSDRHILHLHVDYPAGHDPKLPERLYGLLENITPRVQMTEPDSAVLDLTSALAYWRRDARSLTELAQLSALAHLRVRPAAGCAGDRMRVLDGSGHLLLDDAPDEIVALVGRALAASGGDGA